MFWIRSIQERPVRKTLRLASTVAALLVAGCLGGSLTSDLPVDPDADLYGLALDISSTDVPGQASLPGFAMSAEPTFLGAIGAAEHCVADAGTRRTVCDPVTRDGVTFTRTWIFSDASGTPQTSRTAETRAATLLVDAKGTTSTSRGPLVIERHSSLNISGLSDGATVHTLGGLEDAQASGTVATDRGTATLVVLYSGVVSNVVVPAPFSATSWPVTGTMSRLVRQTVTRAGVSRSSLSVETVLYNGTSVVPMTRGRDGSTTSCTFNLATRIATC
ncbi:MAG: hypothetical protein JWM71_775 [Solirubrobacteraceae bacterium]|nr:hypothetical protein [Solirubrobacteraceae bacterium]